MRTGERNQPFQHSSRKLDDKRSKAQLKRYCPRRRSSRTGLVRRRAVRTLPGHAAGGVGGVAADGGGRRRVGAGIVYVAPHGIGHARSLR